MTQGEFAGEVGEALSRLHDPVALRAHPLARARGPAALRSDLLAAIETLRPASEVDRANRAWRPHQLLTLRYIEGQDAAETARRLAVSRSQFYREHEAAVAAVADVLRERGWAHPSAETTVGSWRRLPAPRVLAAVAAAAVVLVAVIVAASVLGGTPRSTSVYALSVYAGDGQSGHLNGPAATARFAGQFGLAVDTTGTLYVADTGNNRIRRIATSGIVFDVAGSGISGYVDGAGADAQFASPNAVTLGPTARCTSAIPATSVSERSVPRGWSRRSPGRARRDISTRRGRPRDSHRPERSFPRATGRCMCRTGTTTWSARSPPAAW